nr:protein FAR1-RELATED SEQUENCE 5-like [Ziziphus jujuba var. spinosa]
MGNKQPKTIFTDEDRSMANAIEVVLPKAHHRLCTWYIAKNATKHLASYYGNPEFKKHFNKCFHSCYNEVEFQAAWDDMILKFNLDSHPWLKKLYALRQKWCQAFSLNTFSVNIKSTQRSESTNNVFHQISTKTMDIVDFVHHYENKIEEMRLAELEEDFRYRNGMPHLKVKSGIFKDAASEYTMKIFSFFEQELMSCFGVRMTEISNNGIDYIYEAFEEGCKRIFKVQFSSLTSTISYSCKLFESMGLLCCHALKVIDSKNFTCIPKQYVMKRWTKGAKKEVVGSYDLSYSFDKEKKSAQSLRLSELMHQGNFVFSVGSLSDLGTKIIKQKLMEALKILENDEEIANVMGNLNKRDNNISSNECLVLNPSIIRAKDVTNARIKNGLEKRKKKSAKVGGSSQSSRPNTMSFGNFILLLALMI